jgi:hypothetical protein
MANLKQFIKDYSVQIIIGIALVVLTLVLATTLLPEDMPRTRSGLLFIRMGLCQML